MTPLQRFRTLINPTIVEEIHIPPRPERRAPIPPGFNEGEIAKWLSATTGGQSTLWLNQSATLELIARGEHVVAATGTASGKTLAFMATAIREMFAGDGTTLVLLPQRALASDQRERWKDAVELAGFLPETVGEIDRDTPMSERDQIIETASVLMTTPDLFHAWAMRQTSAPVVRHFLQRLRYVVIDEAHSYEGVFGSNSGYLFRRLLAAAHRAKSSSGATSPDVQLLAATATIADPAEHLKRLTGCKFAVVDEDQNGAPYHGLTLLHIEGPANGGPAEKMVIDIASKLAPEIAPDALIAFIDGRQAVERVAKACDDGISPYRSGYEAEDRQRIETALRRGSLRGVISTSALELGVDIPAFTIGMNLGVPSSRKALRQRMGRTGRASEAVFAVIAPANAFTQTGSSFREFVEGPVEPSPIYLENEIIQYQQACCLHEECVSADGLAVLPPDINWGDTFGRAFAMAQPAAPKSREVERIAMMANGSPHLDYPLRRLCETEYVLRLARAEGTTIGKINIDKAMREAHPGATYIHCGQIYVVTQWRSSTYDRSILLRPVGFTPRTSAMIRTQVSVSHDCGEIIDGRLLTGPTGAFAEVSLRVAESVEGFTRGSKQHFFHELSKTDRHMSRKQREFSSTGITIEIDEPWFAGAGDGPACVRRMIAEGLIAVLAREKSIAPSDIRFAHSGIAKIGRSGPRRIDNGLVIFDNVLGGLRLTEWLFANFNRALELLRRGVDRAGPDALVDLRTIERLQEWHSSLEQPGAHILKEYEVAQEGERIIYAPGSTVGIRLHGTLQERKLVDHRVVDLCGTEQLMYLYESNPGVNAFIPHDQVEPVGHDWRHVIWNPTTNSTKEFASMPN